MISRGIQVIGLIIAMISLLLTSWLRERGRLTGRAFMFWIGFWIIFVVMDVFPSLTSYITPFLDLGTNMYTLTAFSIMSLFVITFSLFSYISDLNYKINKMAREQALLGWRSQMLEKGEVAIEE